MCLLYPTVMVNKCSIDLWRRFLERVSWALWPKAYDTKSFLAIAIYLSLPKHYY